MSLILTTRRLCSNVLLNARAVFWLQKECLHECHPLNTAHKSSDSDSDNETQNQSHKESTQEHTTESSEDEVKHKILTAALEYVPVHGWTTQALSEGARAKGFPGVAHGMFPRGGGDLVHHFVRECNSRLEERLAAQSQEMQEEKEEDEGKKRRRTSAFIRDALETRLRMTIPYVESWPQAMALTALPANIGDHFSNLSKLMDDIWHYAGDKSTDFNWYTKRVSLAVVYKSTELHLVQDDSADFQETWLFLDRRLADVATFGRFRADVDSAFGEMNNIASAAFTTGRNMIGLNDRRR